jgi:hypothetical protein
MTSTATTQPCVTRSKAIVQREVRLFSRQECEIISKYRWAGSETQARRAVRDYANLMGASLGYAEDALGLWIHLLGGVGGIDEAKVTKANEISSTGLRTAVEQQ